MSRKLPKIVAMIWLSIFVCLLGYFLLFILFLESGQVVDLSGFQTESATAEGEPFRGISLLLLVEFEQGTFDTVFAAHYGTHGHLSVCSDLLDLVEGVFVLAHS